MVGTSMEYRDMKYVLRSRDIYICEYSYEVDMQWWYVGITVLCSVIIHGTAWFYQYGLSLVPEINGINT